jgi:glycosyltransferase involved in cell wall biosynthesis
MQSVPPNEHLIIDGSTNDEIVQWLTKNTQPSYRKWIHEKDKGISDAFNKGITNAKGEIIHLLNSGDKYADNEAISVVRNVFTNDHSIMWTQSLYIQHRGDMDVVSGVPFNKEQLWKGMRTVAHPTMFIKKEVYDRQGLYSTDHKIAMDYDLLVRIRNERSHFIPRALVYFAPGGVSNTSFKKGLKEVRKSHTKHVGKSYRQMFWQIRQRLLHQFMQTGLGKRWFRSKNKTNQKDS